MKTKRLRQEVDAELSAIQRGRKKELAVYNGLFLALELFLPAIITAILLNFVFGLSRVYGDSMIPTFNEGDLVLYARYQNTPTYGDVIVAHKPGHEHTLIKRVIGLPGDVIDIVDGIITVNSIAVQAEDYTPIGDNILHDVTFPITLGENEYFLLGDNREVSLDSRSIEIGNITQDNILGEATFFIRMLK